ncbi:hypothetical protein [Pedobacter zeae]|uniref:Uncharacterized protein n=1 Tax=Pedobacter zeae TaxID=1737356 RepID=A0A7W6K9N2_9SPHI|nr:hypothetical protein [Pedobacter zeae]MBB4107758.1 hypothetical protein [Pedobacter zeae]GGG97236.1 hypothetical protein GCM10007422_08960 [Pedobacter zeae]
MEKLQQLLLGTVDVPTYCAAFVFALIGALISLRLKATNRDKLSDSTPYAFSWKFLIQDNFLQLITGICLTFLAFRFCNELLGKELTMWLAVLIGALNNEVAGLFEKIQNKARETFK